MANNGGRQGGGGGGGAGNSMNEHIEFTVKAEEDLYLEGTENTIRRVTAETNYSCLMLKTQRFSSLFRHYAKYHGLRKDDLEYYFVNPLQNEDTPESVQLQRSDTIMVRKHRKPEPPEPASDDSEFFKDLKDLLEEEEHMDAIFVIRGGTSKIKPSLGDVSMAFVDSDGGSSVKTDGYETEIKAHKCILTARSEYFKSMFNKTTSFLESSTSKVLVDPCFSVATIRRMLEFLYCNRIENLADTATDEILSLLHLSDLWQLRDLKRLCEHNLIQKSMDVETVTKMYCSASEYNGKRLSDACISFIMDNIREVTSNASFQEEMQNYPHLCIPVLQAAAELVPEPMHKKQRTDGIGGTSGGVSGAGGVGCSSPVPDSDS